MRHPDFDFAGGANDIMILRLRHEVTCENVQNFNFLQCNVYLYAFAIILINSASASLRPLTSYCIMLSQYIEAIDSMAYVCTLYTMESISEIPSCLS